MPKNPIPGQVTTTRRSYVFIAVALVIALALFANHHLDETAGSGWRVFVNAVAFVWLVTLLVAAHTNRHWERPEGVTDDLKVVVVAPFYNEDPVTFRAMLNSLDAQTRPPDIIHVVDDGSPSRDCAETFDAWAEHTQIDARLTWKTNNGKREAQVVAFKEHLDADIFVTIDSDTVLDPRAIEEGLKPFSVDPKIMSVAGLLLGLNARSNLLTRLVDLGFVCSFLNGRASWSRIKSVAVNCGGLAFYRAKPVILDRLDEYLNMTVRGRPVASGDDRILTGFALLEGFTVFQESSVGFTLLPEQISHLTRQRVRWWRSFYWGGIWLLRKLRPNRTVWWLIAAQYAALAMYTVVLVTVLIVHPFTNGNIPWEFVVYLIGLSYVRSARYLSVNRPDQTYGSQLLTYGLAPLSALLHFYLCSCLQYVGLATFGHAAWGTRSTIEVSTAPPSEPAVT